MNPLRCALICGLVAAIAGTAFAQQQPVPQPYPKVGQPQTQPPPTQPGSTPQPAAPPAAAQQGDPSEATLGVPLYPAAQFIASYDAGKGQRFYLFGTTGAFADVVAYYRSVLKQKGELVFQEPATQQFDIARFRADTMGFPPSITVKDYTWGGMKGYLVAKPKGESVRYPTVIQVVPIPAAAAAPVRR